MRSTLAIIIVTLLALMAWQLAGCMTPPKGTVWIDTSGDGRVDALVLADDDGNPVVDEATGQYFVVEGPAKHIATIEQIEDLGSTALIGLGAILGMPILVGIGSFLKGAKMARRTLNLVMSVQAARKALADRNMTEALEIVDHSLQYTQTRETQAAVEAVKAKESMPSVTDDMTPEPAKEAA